VKLSSLVLKPLNDISYQLWRIYGDDCEAISGMVEWQGKPNNWEETIPSAALSTTDPT
jgi:hypothetical protein